MSGIRSLPPDLPRPVDDRAADHLVGTELPVTSFASTAGQVVDLRSVDTPWLVLYVYPRTGGPGVELPDDWALIPGAKGCSYEQAIEHVRYPVFPPDQDAAAVARWLREAR